MGSVIYKVCLKSNENDFLSSHEGCLKKVEDEGESQVYERTLLS